MSGLSGGFCVCVVELLLKIHDVCGGNGDICNLLKVLANATRLAQLVERWPFKPVVVDSSPTGGVCQPLCSRP